MHTITVDLKERSYPIHLGVQVLGECAALLKQARLGPQVFIVTNDTVAKLHLEALRASFAGTQFTVQVITIPDGEKYKNQDTVNQLYDELIRARCERSAVIVALGGGVVGDVAGFVAATLLRGVPFVQIPTTLLAQTDSSVGGKVGINHPLGKNLIGAFYQPRLVLVDLATLSTLPKREFIAGLGEVVKYGVIRDEKFFTLLENTMESIVGLEVHSLAAIVKTCCAIKAAVVREDETEQGVRAILNYGHTFGHALETVTNYQRYKHGEAVMMGMRLAGKTALDLGLWSRADFDRQDRLLVKLFRPKIFPRITARNMIACMRLDKKVRAGSLRLVLPRRIGRVELVPDVPEKVIAGAITWFLSHRAHLEEK